MKTRRYKSTTERTVYAYNDILGRLLDERLARDPSANPDRMSDKTVAELGEVSERAIQNARKTGVLDPYTADHLVCKALGLHPMLVLGEDWLTPEAFFAEEIRRGVISPEDLEGLSTEDCIKMVWEEIERA